MADYMVTTPDDAMSGSGDLAPGLAGGAPRLSQDQSAISTGVADGASDSPISANSAPRRKP